MNIDVKNRFKSGNGWAIAAELTFDTSYPTGGESLSPADLGLSVIEAMNLENSAGYSFDYDKANSKVLAYMVGAHTHSVALDTGASAAGAAHTHAFSSKPALIVEEAVTVSSHAGTLANVPLYILAITSAVGTTTGAFRQIPVGKTPLTKQCAVNMTTGGLTFRAADAVTSAKITYIPKRATGYLSSVTVDEEATASASKVNLAARAGLIQYVWDDTDGVLVDFEQPGTAPSATHYCTVDINDSSNSSIDSHADDAGNTLLVTYVPYSQIPPGCFIDDTDISLSSEAYNFVSENYMYPVIPGFGNQIIGETAGAARSAATLQGVSGTALNGVATMNFAKNYLLTDQSTAMTVVSIPWMILDANQLTPFGTNANESTHTHGAGTLADAASGSASATAAEVGDGTDLEAVVTQLVAYGY